MIAGVADPPVSVVRAIGRGAVAGARSVGDAVGFLGSTVLALARRRPDGSWRLGSVFAATLREAGPGSLPIVAVLGFAMGGVLSLVANDQLEKLGAQLLA